jgi:hypothetical protein
MPGNYTLRKTYVDGDILSASDYVADHQQHIDNQTPQGTDDYSANVTQYRANTDTGDVGSESLPSTLAGELERLRFAIKHIKGVINGTAVTQWYSKSYTTAVPNSSVTSAKLANGATHIQYIRLVSATSAVVDVVDTVFASQAITLTRTRVRLRAFLSVSCAKTGAADTTLTLTLQRGGATVATSSFIASGGAGQEYEVVLPIEFLDTVPAPGSFTYTVELLKTGATLVAVAHDCVLTLEEVA